MHSQKLNISETLLSNYSNNLSKQLHRKKLLYNEAFYTNPQRGRKIKKVQKESFFFQFMYKCHDSCRKYNK